MRVLFLSQWFDPEPGPLPGLARELVRRGMDIEVVTGFPNYPGGRVYPGYRVRPWQRETLQGVPIVRVPLWPSHDTNAVHRIANYASFALSSAILGPALVKPADVCYVYHPPATIGLAATTFKHLHRTPFIYHIADMWPESVVESGMLGHGATRRFGEAALDVYCKALYRSAAAITVVTPGFKRLLVERGVSPDRIHVIYNWCDDRAFREMPRDEKLAKELGFQGKVNFVYSGNLGAFQGLEAIIKAAVRVKHVPEIQIVFVGTGVREESLKKVAGELAATNVRFVGRRDMRDMPAINALSDVSLVHLRDLPFFRYTIPGKMQVCMASGRPMLMAVAGDAADVIRWADAGINARPEDDEDIARAMLELHAMGKERREQLGRNGHEYYRREMSLEVGAKRVTDLFSTVVGSA